MVETKKEREARRERVRETRRNAGQVQFEYAWLLNLIASDDTGSLQEFFNWINSRYEEQIADARAGKVVPDVPFTQAEFDRRFEQTAWRQRYTSYEAQRRQEAADPALARDVEFRRETSRNNILAIAEEYGIGLSQSDIDQFTEMATFQGWDDRRIRNALEPLLERTIAEGGDLIGRVGDAETDLMQWMARNGLQLARQDVAKFLSNVTLGRQSLEDVKADIRRTYLAGMYPAWADRINEGFDPETIFAPYKSYASRLLEIEDIGLDDPIMKRITQAVGADGKPVQKPLWEFEQEIRKDPRWQQTDNAYATYTDVGTELLRMFGFR